MGEERDNTPNEICLGLISKTLFHAIDLVPALCSGIAWCPLAAASLLGGTGASPARASSPVQLEGLWVESREQGTVLEEQQRAGAACLCPLV